jgi:hypothetical protein
MLNLPLWFIKQRKPGPAPGQPPCNDPQAMIAFTTTENLTEFLATSQPGQWSVHMAVDRESLVLLISDAHQIGMESICLDPQEDGTGGQQISLHELAELLDSL